MQDLPRIEIPKLIRAWETFRAHNHRHLNKMNCMCQTRTNTEKSGVEIDLGYAKIKGKSRYNLGKLTEIKERVSM